MRKLIRRSSLLLLALVALFLLTTLYFGRSPYSIVAQAIRTRSQIQELRANEEKWGEEGPSTYQVHVTNLGYTQFSVICHEATITVQEGRILNRAELQALGVQCLNIFEDLTVEGLFGLARDYLMPRDPIHDEITIKFNDEYGYIEYLEVVEYTTLPEILIGTGRVGLFTIELHEFKPVE